MTATVKDSSSVIRRRLHVSAQAARLIHNLHRNCLIVIATKPERLVADINERICSLLEILRRGNIKFHETLPIFRLLTDGSNYPISGNLDRDTKENNSYLRGGAALAIASFGAESNGDFSEMKEEFIHILTGILDEIRNDRLFESSNKAKNYYFEHFKYFLAALYLVHKDLAEAIMQYYSIEEKEIITILKTFCPVLEVKSS